MKELLIILATCALLLPQAPAVSEQKLKKAPVVTVNDGDYHAKLNVDEVADYISHINDNRSPSVKPEICKKNGEIIVTKYKYGNLVDTAALSKYVKEKGLSVFEINVDDFIIDNPEYASDYKVLREKTLPYRDFKIEYTNGETIDLSDFEEFVTVNNNEITTAFDGTDFDKKVAEVVRSKASSFDTYYGEWTFNSTLNGAVKIQSDKRAYCSSTYGSKVNFKEEAKYVKNALLSLTSEKGRVPVLSLNNGFQIPDTYIEVSINDQHLWYYKDGKLLMESNVVTGNLGTNDTPIGVYFIDSMFHGMAFNGGLSSKNWMKFTARGHGLHDATWRPDSDFESAETYKGRGSHGCVNLPLEFSSKLFDAVDIGTVVVIY